MLEYGPLYASVVYYALMAILTVLFLWWAISIVRKFIVKTRREKGVDFPFDAVGAVLMFFKCLCLAVIFGAISVYGWTLKQDYLSHLTEYENPAQQEELQAIEESVPLTVEELDSAKAKLKTRQETSRHEGSLESFDEKMKREAAKIKKRNQPAPEDPEAEEQTEPEDTESKE